MGIFFTMFKKLFLTIPAISSLIFGGLPLFASAQGGNFEISVTSKRDVPNASAKVYVGSKVLRVPLGKLEAGRQVKINFNSLNRLSAGTPVEIVSSSFSAGIGS